MTNRAAAAPFARALFDVARQSTPQSDRHGDPQSGPVRVGHDLNAFIALVEAHPDLLKVLINAAIPPAAKANVLHELFKLQPLADPLARTLLLLAERDQLIILPEIAALYEERLLDFLHVVRAEVTTAEPLSSEHHEALERGLAQATGRRVQMSTRVDPAIIGGLVARIGSRVFDGSIARHLARVRDQLVEA
jgi:F-type H+-transporting ATPase subunit delta